MGTILKELLLTNHQREKILFLEMMHDSPVGDYSIQTIGRKCNYASGTIYQLAREANEELVAMGEEPILVTGNKVACRHDTQRLNHYVMKQYQTSIPYLFLLFSLQYPEKDIKDFSKEFFVSQSTVVRKLKPLLTYLKDFEIKINISNMQLLGKESAIRIVYYNFIWAASLGESMTFSGRSFDEEQQLVNKLAKGLNPNLHPDMVKLLFSISRIRNEQQHFLEPLPFTELLFPRSEVAITHYLESYLTNQIQVTRNVEFISYMIYYYPYTVEDLIPTDQMNVMDLYFQKKLVEGDSFSYFIQRFYHESLNTFLPFPLNENENRALLDNILSTFFNYRIQKKKIMILAELQRDDDVKDSQAYHDLHDQIYAYLVDAALRSDLTWLVPLTDDLSVTLTLVLLPFYHKRMVESPVRVSIVPMANYQVFLAVCHYLEQFAFVELVFNHEDVDLYITTFKELLPDAETPYYLLNLLANKDFEVALYEKLLCIQRGKRTQQLTQVLA